MLTPGPPLRGPPLALHPELCSFGYRGEECLLHLLSEL
uniref:Uncharacterized protein n=1 Tax=Lepeophtheirus salmonis TaxID=72036 RepID=A0A0K2U5F6_LEPSM